MTTRCIKEPDDGGVSESIGFLLIFTIIIAGIGLVTLYGYPLLMQQQVSADESIMEKNMIVLQNDIKSLAYKTVPYKETSLKIGGGSLGVYNPSHSPTLEIEYPSSTLIESFQSGELRYESVSSQTNIVIENGAVIKQPRIGQGSTMLAEPRWFYDEPTQTMVINLIKISSTEDAMAREGIGTVRMKLTDTGYTSYGDGITQQQIRIIYPSDYSVAWRNFLTKDNTLDMDYTGGTTYIKDNVKRLVVKKFDVKIESI